MKRKQVKSTGSNQDARETGEQFLSTFFGLEADQAGVKLQTKLSKTKCTNAFRRISSISYSDCNNATGHEDGGARAVKWPKYENHACFLCGLASLSDKDAVTLACCRQAVCLCCFRSADEFVKCHPECAAFVTCEVCHGIKDNVSRVGLSVLKCCRQKLCGECVDRWAAGLPVCEFCGTWVNKMLATTFQSRVLLKPFRVKTKSKESSIISAISGSRHLDAEDLSTIAKSTTLRGVNLSVALNIAQPAELLYFGPQDVIPAESLLERTYNQMSLLRQWEPPYPATCQTPCCLGYQVANWKSGFHMPALLEPDWVPGVPVNIELYSRCLLCLLFQQQVCLQSMFGDTSVYDAESDFSLFYFALRFTGDVDLTPVSLGKTEFVIGFKNKMGFFKPKVHYSWLEAANKLSWTSNGTLDSSRLWTRVDEA